MALIHTARLDPPKSDLVGRLLAAAPWAPSDLDPAAVTLVGAYRLDDPSGEVGIEGHLATAGEGGVVWHVPLTYRAAPLAGAEEHLVGEMEHGVLGTRYVYDAVGDPTYLSVATAAALTGLGQSAELRQDEHGHWVTRAASVRLAGGGWGRDWVGVGAYSGPQQLGDSTTLRSADRELRVERRPRPTQRPDRAYDLTATWSGQNQPALLARVTRTATPVDAETGYES